MNFQNDTRKINFNGNQVDFRIYNLITTIAQMKLFCKGLIPHRNFKFSDVKNYFQVKGNKESVLAQLQQLLKEHNSK